MPSLKPFPKPHIMERCKGGLDKSCTHHFKLFIEEWDVYLLIKDTMLLSGWIPNVVPRNSAPSYQKWLCSAIHPMRDFSGGQSTQSTSCSQHQQLGESEIGPSLWQSLNVGMVSWHHGVESLPVLPRMWYTSKPDVWYGFAGASIAGGAWGFDVASKMRIN